MDTLNELVAFQVDKRSDARPFPTKSRLRPGEKVDHESLPRQFSDGSPFVNYTFLVPVSVIVPTFREATNAQRLIERVEKVRDAYRINLELIFVDDNSGDGIVEIVETCQRSWVKIRVRTQDRGLSQAVLEGLQSSNSPIMIVMDADLTHPPEAIPQLIIQLDLGADFVLGSRYASGGSTDQKWRFFRWINRRVATLMARPLVMACDPMAGFFALPRTLLANAERLNPIGDAIALELIVKCHAQRIAEVPIHFADRRHGESQLTLKEQFRYLQHLRRLYIFRFQRISTLMQFLVVGASGVGVNLAVLTSVLWLTSLPSVAVVSGVLVSVITNFLLNRRFTFGHIASSSIMRQFVGFVAMSAVGVAVNVVTTILVTRSFPAIPLQAAAMTGIVAGTMINYVLNSCFVFKAPVR